MQDISEFSIRKVITVELITCLCIGFLLSLVAVLFCPADKDIIGLRKEIFMFIAGSFTMGVSTAMALYFNRTDRKINEEVK